MCGGLSLCWCLCVLGSPSDPHAIIPSESHNGAEHTSRLLLLTVLVPDPADFNASSCLHLCFEKLKLVRSLNATPAVTLLLLLLQPRLLGRKG